MDLTGYMNTCLFHRHLSWAVRIYVVIKSPVQFDEMEKSQQNYINTCITCRPISEITYYVSSGMLTSIQSLTWIFWQEINNKEMKFHQQQIGMNRNNCYKWCI